MILRDVPVYWRVGKNSSSDLDIPARQNMRIEFDREYGHVVQVQSDALLDTLSKIYQKSENIGYLQDGPIGDQAYAREFSQHIDLVSGNLKAEYRVLEIGSGNKSFINFSDGRYSEYHTIDPLPLQSIGSKHFHHSEYFPSANLKNDYFDLVVHYNFLEHVRDPRAVIEAITEVLRPNGVLLFAVPDCSLSTEIGDIGMLLHQHLHYFTTCSVEKLVRNCGLTVNYISRSNYGGSLIVSAKKGRQSSRGDNIVSLNEEIFFRSVDSRKAFIERQLDVNPRTVGLYVPLRSFPWLSALGRDPDHFKYFDDKKGLEGLYYDGCNSEIRNILAGADDIERFLVFSHVFFDRIEANIRNSYPHVEVRSMLGDHQCA